MQRYGSNNIFKTAVTIAVLIFIIFFTPLKETSIVKSAGHAAIFVTYPFQFMATKAINGTRGIITSIFTIRSLQKENRELRRKLGVERSVNSAFESLIKQNDNLRELLNFKSSNPFRMNLLPAEIISRSPSLWFKTITVDKGGKDGVMNGRAVVSRDGLVGRIIEVYGSKSKVLLITDEDSAVSAKIKRTGDIGVIRGTGSYTLLCLYVRSDSEIRSGDEIVTSGISNFYPVGIPVGTITSISKRAGDLFLRVEVKGAADISKIESAFVVR